MVRLLSLTAIILRSGRALLPAAATLGLIGAALLGEPANAGDIYGFGDSQLDTRRVCAFFAALGAYPGSSGACSNGPGVLQLLPKYTGLTFNKANNYAVGGAQSGDGVYIPPVPGAPSFPNTNGQVTEFLAAGGHFAPGDTVVFSALTNDWVRLLTNPNLSGEALGQAALAENKTSISRLISAGARSLVVYGGGDVSTIFGYLSTPDQIVRERNFGLTYSVQLASSLAPLAGPGVQIRVLDRLSLYSQIAADPQRYGFINGTDKCSTVPSCASAQTAVQNQYFLWDLHPTTAGFDLFARYIANVLGAQDEIPLQANLLRGASEGFSSSIFARLDAFRLQNSAGVSYGTSYASYGAPRGASKAAAPQPQNPWSIYMYGLYAGAGDRGVASSPTGFGARDTDSEGAGGVVGVDYRFGSGLLAGVSFSYSRPSSSGQNGGQVSATLPQFAGYVSSTHDHWFADAVVTGGPAYLDINRLGVIDKLHASPMGSVFSASVRSGYLFDVVSAKLGPVGQLTYGRSTIDRYTESGDPVLTNMVWKQSVDSLVGSLGVQARLPFDVGTMRVNPFINLTAEHDFLASSRWIIAEETAALGLPIWTLASGSNNGVYGKASAGATVSIGRGLDVFLTAQSTFSRAGGDLRSATTGIQYHF
jgi:outer membrane lipase/esterase